MKSDNMRGLRLHVTIIGMTAIIVVMVTFANLVVMHLASDQAARSSAETLFTGTAAQVDDHIDGLLRGTKNLAALAAVDSRPLAPPAPGDTQASPAIPLLRQVLETNSALYSAYIGFADGGFLQLIAARRDSRILDAHKAPPETWYILRGIDGAGDDRVQRWFYLAEDGGLMGQEINADPTYDPRVRPWYIQAAEASGATLSQAYVFASLQAPGLTAAHALADGAGVFGIDISLAGLEDFLQSLPVSDNGGIVLLDGADRMLAASPNLVRAPLLSPIAELAQASPLAGFAQMPGNARYGASAKTTIEQDDKGTDILVRRAQWNSQSETPVKIAVIAPLADFTGHVDRMQKTIVLVSLILLAAVLPATFLPAKSISNTVRRLTADAQRVRALDFSGPVAAPSRIMEFDLLSSAFTAMKDDLHGKTRDLETAQNKLEKIIQLGIAMAAEKDSARLMEMILTGAKALANADGGTLYLIEGKTRLTFQILRNTSLHIVLGGTEGPPADLPPVMLFDENGEPNHGNVVSHCVHQQTTIVIDDAYTAQGFDFSGTKAFDAKAGYRSTSFLTVPLKPRGGDVIGALQLINAKDPETGRTIAFEQEIGHFVEALSAQAATALYNRRLLDEQEDLLDGMIEIIAGAIDAKSPYTGGHCARVPELALMLAEQASAQQDGPLAEFAFTTEDQWREFRIGAWLHDCGKVITPEYVVDKATKLETIYNRIHEVRTRFEVLLRDAQIDRLTALLGGAEPQEADAAYEARRRRLIDDFAFVAECNVGGEFMAPEKIERLRSIAGLPWTRHFDDRLGLSQEEMRRLPDDAAPMPAVEPLLADKPQHIVPRPKMLQSAALDAFGVRMDVPENLYNFGEMHNLTVKRGTLSDEERYKINEHIVQTIVMLERMPWPEHLRKVPEYAGTHHETLTGSGYPRKLTEDQLSVPARIMAIADIFEALTASDRPYKKPKTLSQAVDILSKFRDDRHIDGDLFDLFLTSGTYKRYGETYLSPDQIDEVEIARYLGRADQAVSA